MACNQCKIGRGQRTPAAQGIAPGLFLGGRFDGQRREASLPKLLANGSRRIGFHDTLFLLASGIERLVFVCWHGLLTPVRNAEYFFHRGHTITDFLHAVCVNTGPMLASHLFQVQLPGAFVDQRTDFL